MSSLLCSKSLPLMVQAVATSRFLPRFRFFVASSHHEEESEWTMVVISKARPSLQKVSFKILTYLVIVVIVSYPFSLLFMWRKLVEQPQPPKPRSPQLRSSLQTGQQDRMVIGYAVSITGCGSDPLTEGAAVLQHSIHMAHSQSRHHTYGYQLYAIVHPTAVTCAQPLEKLGYTLLIRDVFVAVENIQGEFLRKKITSNGCCGEKELIKLEAYTLTQHPIVVHLDLDVLILKNMDELFDFMLTRPTTPLSSFQWSDRPIPEEVNAFYTMDYNMAKPKTKYKPVQGGFLVLRPDQRVYEEFREIVRKGDFREGKGWGGQVGPFYGSMTFQGLIPYYYEFLHPGQSIELNRCIYNQMCDNPRTGRTTTDPLSGKAVLSGDCRTGEQECEDCRNRSIDEVVTSHFTVCQKPWFCMPHSQKVIQHRLCRQLVHAWYAIRSDMEKSWGRQATGSGSFDKDQFFGYCSSSQKKGYIPIAEPYGQPAVY